MQWNRRNILVAILILVLGFGSGGVIYIHQQGGWKFAMFRLEKWLDGLNGVEPVMTAEEERIAKGETERIRKVIFTKHPSLQLEGKDVPSEQNGYLALFELAKNSDLNLLIDSRILYQASQAKADPAALRKELDSFDTVGKEIERVAALPMRSNIIDGRIHDELLPAGVIKSMGDYLCLKARLAALEGNEDESFRYLSLAENLAENLGSIEVPYFLSETVSIMVRRSVRSDFSQWILPTFDKSTDLEKWRAILEPRTDYPQRHALLIKGEWNMIGVNYMHMLFDMVPDPEGTMVAWARYTDANAKRYELMNFQQYAVSKVLPHEPFTKNLSREGSGVFDVLLIGSNAWTNGVLRSVVFEHHFAAGLDLLIREQKGEDISKLTETYLLNPQTVKPFGYNAATRTLDEVTGVYDVEELKLPW